MTDGAAGPPVQNVTAVNGFAYGAIGADVHVFADQGPVYLLTKFASAAEPDPEALVSQPSRMLNARLALVGFTGRDDDIGALADWRDAASRAAARWLHAPGGQGKTRLAEHFARLSAALGWKVVTAVQGRGSILPPPGSQDLGLEGAAGLLLIVDYADRWPLSHLTWLFSNSLFHRAGVPTRMLLLARSAYPWPAIRGVLDDQQFDTSEHRLEPLPADAADRGALFNAARDAFAAHYGIDDASSIVPADPVALAEHPDYGLTLTVLMAALVAVDAHVHGARPPADAAGLSGYLLDRERLRWTRLYENSVQGLDFQTAPRTMGRAVFTAALTGPVDYATGRGVVTRLALEPSAQRVLDDHTVCYPPQDPAAAGVLEPLYPDRLAEDLLALSLPGHQVPGYPADPWTADASATILLPDEDDGAAPTYAPRGVVFLVAAAQRWPHVADAHLYPLLRRSPGLAVSAGGAAVTAIAQLPGIALDVLEGIEALLPVDGPADLDLGAAAVVAKLTEHRLASTDDPAEHGRLYTKLGSRMFSAGLYREARRAMALAVAVYLALSEEQAALLPDFAASLTDFAVALESAGHLEDALWLTEQAVAIYADLLATEPSEAAPARRKGLRRLIRRPEPAAPEPTVAELDATGRLVAALGSAILSNATLLSRLGRAQEAVDSLDLALLINTTTAEGPHADVFAPDLAEFQLQLGFLLGQVGRWQDAVAATEKAVTLYRGLAARSPDAYMPALATAVNNLGSALFEAGRREEALPAAQEAVDLRRELAAANPLAHGSNYALSLFNLSSRIYSLGRWGDAVAPARESVELLRELAAGADRTALLPLLSQSLNSLAQALFSAGHHAEAPAVAQEGVLVSRELAESQPAAYTPLLAKALNTFGAMHLHLGTPQEAAAPAREAADLYRGLAAERPERFLAEFGQSLANLGMICAQTDHLSEALAASTESVSAYREMIASDAGSQAHLPGLAHALALYAGMRADAVVELDDAWTAIEEASDILQPFYQALPAAYLGVLVIVYQTAAKVLDGLGRDDEAAAIRRDLLGVPPTEEEG